MKKEKYYAYAFAYFSVENGWDAAHSKVLIHFKFNLILIKFLRKKMFENQKNSREYTYC